jgi:hypothetical protein
MKYILSVLFVFVLGCSDDDLNSKQIDHDIIGKWQMEATKISPGGIVDWSEVTNGEIYELKTDGTLLLSKWDSCKGPISGTFAIDEDKLFLKFSCDSTLYEPNYFIWFEEEKLILGFVGCIEECSYRFRSIK